MLNFKKIAALFLCIAISIAMLSSCTQGEPGPQGVQGEPGVDGTDGKDGVTPTVEISTDGYWVINGTKTE